jgi:hypothetical protein
MTESEWLACDNPDPLLAMLWTSGRQNERKLRLFGVACVRRIWHLLSPRASRRFHQAAKRWAHVHNRHEGAVYQASRECVEVVERYADGLASDQQLLEAWESASGVVYDAHDYIQPEEFHEWAATAAACLAQRDAELLDQPGNVYPPIEFYNVPLNAALAVQAAAGRLFSGGHGAPEEFAAQAFLVRDIFGNPFRLLTVDSAWLTPTVVSLAHAIYDDRAFDRMPIVADALEDAGCTHLDILAHCRGSGPHARGCFVVDLLLKKE